MTGPVVLALTPGWTRIGWALCQREGPVKVGALTPSGDRDFMDLRFQLAALPVGMPRGVALERPAPHRGCDTAHGYELALCAGAIAFWATSYGHPWLIPPHVWRRWWGLSTKPNIADRGPAVEAVSAQGWGQPGADVAEAILLGVGAARHITQWGLP